MIQDNVSPSEIGHFILVLILVLPIAEENIRIQLAFQNVIKFESVESS